MVCMVLWQVRSFSLVVILSGVGSLGTFAVASCIQGKLIAIMSSFMRLHDPLFIILIPIYRPVVYLFVSVRLQHTHPSPWASISRVCPRFSSRSFWSFGIKIAQLYLLNSATVPVLLACREIKREVRVLAEGQNGQPTSQVSMLLIFTCLGSSSNFSNPTVLSTPLFFF